MSSDDGSIFSDLSSDASSQMLDEQSHRRPPRKRIKYQINFKHVKGAVAVGPHARARIKGDEQVSIKTGQLLDNSRDEKAISDNYDGSPNRDTGQYEENTPGSYCPVNSYQRHEENGEKWNARPGSGISFNRGEPTCNLSNEDFFESPEKFIQDMDENAGPLKDAKEDLLLHSILPFLEETWGKCPSSNEEVYENLAKISCSAKCGKAVSQALQLLLQLICKDNFDNCYNNLLVVEAIIRSSILSSEGLFRRGRVDSKREIRELKLTVYSRIISLLVTHQALKGDSSMNCLEQDLKKIKDELKTFGSKVSNKTKDSLRYSTEFIIKAISHLLKPNDKLQNFLNECREFCQNQEIKVNDLRALRQLDFKKGGDWIDLHYIAIHLQGKVHSERPTPRMETERRAMNLLRFLVEKYLDGNGGQDWRFCMLAATIFSDISMKNETKEIRTEAGSSLVYLLKDPKVQKTPECKAIVQSQSEKALFCPDVVTRTFLTHFLNKNTNRQVELDTIQHIKHLSWMHRTQTLEINDTTISKSSTCFVNHGMFQRKKVAVKVLLVKKQHLVEENPNTPAKESLKREAENLRLLNAARHPNFPVLLAHNTKTLPYHLITAFEKSKDLLQFLQKSRGTNPPIQPVQLIKMLLDVTNALLFLEEKGLVHRAVMAANVLVGDSYVCKLSGMQHLRRLTSQTAECSDSVYSYCSAVDGFPDFVSSVNEEELPLRWKAPEVLSECRFSTASDVWALGVLMYEVLTYGCLPYGLTSDSEELCSRVKNGIEILPFESCFEENEYKLMQQCFQFQRRSRPQLFEVKSSLCEMIENADEEQVRSDPPPLTACGSFPARNTEDINRASGAVYEECTSQSIEESYTMPNDPVYEECTSRSADKGPDVSNGPYYVHNLTSDKERVEEKLFNRNPLLDLDDLPRQRQTGRTSDSNVIEKIKRTADHHLRDLLTLKHPNLVTLKIENLDSHCPTANIITEEAPLGNLKNYVLEKQCQIGDIVTFLSQVASVMHYLHENHIVHGDLRATYVNVVSHDKITVGRLGRSKPLNPSEYDVTSTSCVVQVAMHPDATRWSAPEVILDGRYTHASDVWSFGILAWELYTSFANGLDGRDSSLPFFDLDDQKILPHIRDNGPPDKPEGCPEWVYIIIHQCWAYVAQQRPPFLAIFDCLTSRVPMESWIMKLWLKTHDKSEWPDLSTCQSQDAYHVTCLEQHPSSDIIEKMCSPDFFSRHEYKYVCRNFGMAGGKDDYSEANGTPDVPFTGDISPVYSSCSKVKKNLELVPVPEPQKAPNNNDAGYLCPVSITVEDLSSTESNEENDAGVAESTRGDGRERVVPAKETFNLQVKKVKKRSGAHGSSAIDMNGGKASLPADTLASLYVNLGTQPDQQHTSLYQNIDAIPKETSSKNEEYVEGTKAACPNPTEKRNRAVYPKVKKAENTPGLEDQLVPPNHPLYANLVASGELQVTYFV